MDGSTGRVAVIGAGPSGLYTAQVLAAAGISVDVIDRLAAPYGLVRYGVAPDHAKMKSVIRVLQKPFAEGEVHFLGNVTVGKDVRLDELREHYLAVVHATGCAADRSLGVPGENLVGSLGSGLFVGWYCGHPDLPNLDPPLDAPGAVVIGAGNVALDVARVLAKSSEELRKTDVTDQVLAALAASSVRDIHVLIRRGPEHVKFTPVELRQIGELANAEVRVHDDGTLAGIDDSGLDRRGRQNLALLREWAAAPPSPDRPRRIHLRFLRSPVRIEGRGRVHTVVVERNAIEDGRVVPTGAYESIEAGLVVRAIGYAAEPVAGLPFDDATGTVPNEAGRVVADGRPLSGAYVTGWVKRGPTGVIGTNKSDGAETAAAVLEDLSRLPAPAHPERSHLTELLAGRGVRSVDWSGWLRLDAEELRLGAARDAERIKIGQLGTMLATADDHRDGISRR
ncbi:MAG: FAD-dependent oxidoreductase [Sciscionella sp.]